MAVPDFQSFMLPVLRLAANGPLHTAETIAHVSDYFGLSDEDRQERLASGRQTRVASRVYWTFVHLTKADLLRRESRGVYSITEKGQQALAENPQRIDLNFLMARSENYRQFRSAATIPQQTMKQGCRLRLPPRMKAPPKNVLKRHLQNSTRPCNQTFKNVYRPCLMPTLNG